jgi:UDP:flavonoid glycosyltransferase YjiC (YdhE family)
LKSKVQLYSFYPRKNSFLPGNFNIRKVLVAPLDWGLGHATRCIPLVRALLEQGYEAVYAAEGAQAALLKQEFPGLTCLPLEGYRVRYSKQKWWLPAKLLLQLPRLFATVRREHVWLDNVIDKHSIDLVISDNRYGLWSAKVPCIFITHQLTIKAPFAWLEGLLQRNSYRYINRFDACWVPDAEGNDNAAGILSHPRLLPGIPMHYIGVLARFEAVAVPIKYDYCIVLSGPEPQRSILEQKILRDIALVKGNILLVRGKPGSIELLQAPAHVTVSNHLHTAAMQEALMQSEYIVSRGGYTTIMELLSLKKKMILVPTPGQTEQEYLAAQLQSAKAAFMVQQHALDIVHDLEKAKSFTYQIPVLPVFKSSDLRVLLEKL